MCGFVVSKGGRGNARFVSRRGMDDFGTLERDGLRFEHFLLHITGARTPQPFIDGDVVAVYNGEIYNHPFTRSDGENILPLYGMLGAQLSGAGGVGSTRAAVEGAAPLLRRWERRTLSTLWNVHGGRRVCLVLVAAEIASRGDRCDLRADHRVHHEPG